VAIDLAPYAEAVNSALAEGTFCVVATGGQDGIPDIGFKGSMLVFDRDHLAYWERTRGQHLANLRRNPGVAVMYFSRERGKYLRLYGHASLHEDGPVRDQIMGRVVAPELEKDPERKGIGVLIRVDRLTEPFGGVSQQRDGTAGA
jgi:hypothetical protein